MMVDVPLALDVMPGARQVAAMRETLAAFYSNGQIVAVHGPHQQPTELLLNQPAEPWDGMTLFVFSNEGETQARLVAVLDNLGKGASGAAIQNLNIMCGLPETTGLRL
jgi:N-acetyl-gamma-glutamyl-phosphate reductase